MVPQPFLLLLGYHQEVSLSGIKSKQDKLVIVFGSGTGIGHYLLHRGLNEGYPIVGVSRYLREKCRMKDSDTTCEIFNLNSNNSSDNFYLLGDLYSDVDRNNFISFLEKKSAGMYEIHAIICVGGVKTIDKFENTNKSDILEDFQLNILTPMLIVRDLFRFIPIMQKTTITILGGSGENPYPYRIPYASAKSGLARFVESIAEEWKNLNVLINLALPGPVNTELFDFLLLSKLKQLDSSISNELDVQKLDGGVPVSCVGDLIYKFLIPQNTALSGKSISARFDPWPYWSENKPNLDKNALTFRRVNPF
jgi:short-subunit dehydrogenase